MGVHEFETLYDIRDLVIFEKNDLLQVGIIEGFYDEDNTIWYNIRTSKSNIYTYSNGGDIPEYDIIGKIDNEEIKKDCLDYIGMMYTG